MLQIAKKKCRNKSIFINIFFSVLVTIIMKLYRSKCNLTNDLNLTIVASADIIYAHARTHQLAKIGNSGCLFIIQHCRVCVFSEQGRQQKYDQIFNRDLYCFTWWLIYVGGRKSCCRDVTTWQYLNKAFSALFFRFNVGQVRSNICIKSAWYIEWLILRSCGRSICSKFVLNI